MCSISKEHANTHKQDDDECDDVLTLHVTPTTQISLCLGNEPALQETFHEATSPATDATTLRLY
jgi:hypothetical protein